MTNRCQAEYAKNVKSRLLGHICASMSHARISDVNGKISRSVTGIWDFVFQKCFWNISEGHSNLKSLLLKIVH